jgi:hypothetical protein
MQISALVHQGFMGTSLEARVIIISGTERTSLRIELSIELKLQFKE